LDKLATDTVDVDRLRPSDEDSESFPAGYEDQPEETQDAVLNTDEPAITGPVPLPKGARHRANEFLNL
jgi:hypothetical protein